MKMTNKVIQTIIIVLALLIAIAAFGFCVAGAVYLFWMICDITKAAAFGYCVLGYIGCDLVLCLLYILTNIYYYFKRKRSL
jgi:hypothetical protein